MKQIFSKEQYFDVIHQIIEDKLFETPILDKVILILRFLSVGLILTGMISLMG